MLLVTRFKNRFLDFNTKIENLTSELVLQISPRHSPVNAFKFLSDVFVCKGDVSVTFVLIVPNRTLLSSVYHKQRTVFRGVFNNYLLSHFKARNISQLKIKNFNTLIL